ncbi:phage tail tape measure protein [Streptococcus dysgalactiae]|uniref:Phage tail tape measure protein n=1 Tax=Streptococcus dysgalactiae TaxID=1334 RepID=A0AAF0A0D6_STRDY|nr:phage tail tape measure protein [Streptococcus dysgalactiae]WAI93950.1 phage tail tape measure protein [Streptococcus dysgalactiae]
MGTGTPLGSMFIELGLDTSKFNPKLQSAKRAVNYFKAETRALDSALKSNGNNVGLLQAKYKSLNQAISAQKKVLTSLKSEFDKLEPGTAKWEAAAVQIERENAKLAQLEGQLGSVSKAFKDAASQSGFTGFLQRSGKQIDVFGQKLQTLADKTKWISAGFGAGALLSIKAASDFDTAFTGVKKTVDEVRDANGRVTYSYERLSNGIRKMAKEIPASTTEIAGVAEAAGQLGIKTKDVLGFTRVMIDMGQSTNLSATDAATAIAKIANITGLTSKEYSRFGSSVVALGNNFATTEADIVAMTNRIAASGKLAGLTNQEMLALATAMSSVGIEAEAGGTAMTQTLSAIETAVIDGGEDLTKFAQIANMSSKEFARAWKEKPIVALQEFIKGLGQLDKKGESATKVLDDLGLSGVRQSNMLKSLGLASETLGRAIDVSNTAWKENTALTNEASKRYETFQSKLKIVRNKINDIAIEIGGPLMEAASNALDALEPMFKTIGNIAKAYSNANPETKRFIAYLIAGTAAASPFLRIIGKTSSGVGKLVEWIGKLAGARKGAAALKALESAVEASGAAAGGASTKFGGLTSTISLLSNPIGLLIGGTVALTGVLIALNNAKDKARERSEEWGTTLNNQTRINLENFRQKVDDTAEAMLQFDAKGSPAIANVKKQFADLMAEIIKSHEEANNRLDELGRRLGLSDEQIALGKQRNQQIVDNAQAMTDQINQIYERHNGEVSKLTAEEKVIVENNQRELINAKLSLMDLSNKQEKAIRQAFSNDIARLNETQLKNTMSSLEKALKAEKKSYDQQRADLKEALENKMITQTQYDNRIRQAKAQHEVAMDALAEKYAQAAKLRDEKMQARLRDFTTNNQQNTAKAKALLSELGISYDSLAQKVDNVAKKGGHSVDLLAKSTAKMSEESKQANALWNAMVFDEKTGKIKTNAKEEIKKAAESAEGWNGLQFILKNANLTSNARIEVANALIESGRWNELTLGEKKLVVDNKAGLSAIVNSKENLATWNAMPASVKELLGNNNDFIEKSKTANTALDRWNSLTPKTQKLLAEDLASGKKDIAQAAIDSLTGKTVDLKAFNLTSPGVQAANQELLLVKDKDAKITASDQTATAVAQANANVNSPRQNAPVGMFGIDMTAQSVAQTNASVNSPRQNAPIGMFGLDNTAGPVASANRAVNSPKQNSPAVIRAQDNASSVAQSVKWSLASIPTSVTTTITTFVRKIFGHEKGTDFHPGGLAMVNDQKGPLYKELVTLPTGESFIPEGRDVVLPLPKGSKVLRASKTRDLMLSRGIPKYAHGVGISSESRFIKELSVGNQSINKNNITIDNAEIVSLLKQLIELVKGNKDKDQIIDLTVMLGNMTLVQLKDKISELQRKDEALRLKSSSF